jgi:magnesium-protoporphyrin O-methyltransferase
MATDTYKTRRGQLETYFDRTAVAAWARLTSDAPVSRIRATVRAGRDEMRDTLLAWLPLDMTNMRLLDAGCGTGALALLALARGAEVVAIDLSPKLVALAQERMADSPHAHRITFLSGDMLDPALGQFDYVVLMDSIIHYESEDVLAALANLAARTSRGISFTFAPRTRMLTIMHGIGKLFPRGDRAPMIEPQKEAKLCAAICDRPAFKKFKINRTHRVDSGFYISQALELVA